MVFRSLPLHFLLAVVFSITVRQSIAQDVCNWSEVEKKCPLSQFVISSMEIFEQNLGIDKQLLYQTVTNQWCGQTFMNDVYHTEQCVKRQFPSHCWDWTEWLPGSEGPKFDINLSFGKQHKIVSIFMNYDFCNRDESFLEEFVEIRTCNRNPEVATGFTERFEACKNSYEPNELQVAMDALDVCKGDNKEFSCAFEAMVGDFCPSIRDALIDIGQLSGQGTEVYEEEMYQIEFILKSAYIDNLRLPHPHECDNVRTYKHMQRGNSLQVASLPWTAFILCCCGAIFGYLWCKTSFKHDAKQAFKSFANSHKRTL